MPNPIIRGRTGGGNWTPFRLPGLQLWAEGLGGLYQDSGLTTLAAADSDPVGGWLDRSGNGRTLLEATSSKRPTLKLALVNGKPGLLFDAVDDDLATSGNIGLSGNLTCTLALVVKPGTTSTACSLAGWGNTVVNDAVFSLYQSPGFGGGASGKYSAVFAGGQNFNNSAAIPSGPHLLTLTKAAGGISTTTTLYTNGTAGSNGGSSSTDTPNVTNAAFHLGAWANGTATYNGNILSAVLCSGVLSAADRSQLHRYWAKLYGIAGVA